MEDAVPLRHHVLTCSEAAATTSDPERRRRLLTFVVVGGGPTGVEYAGALSEPVFGPLLRDLPGDPGERGRHRAARGGRHRPRSRYALDRLRRWRVNVRLDWGVEVVEADRVHLRRARRPPPTWNYVLFRRAIRLILTASELRQDDEPV
jgi:NADH dehydrogenase